MRGNKDVLPNTSNYATVITVSDDRGSVKDKYGIVFDSSYEAEKYKLMYEGRFDQAHCGFTVVPGNDIIGKVHRTASETRPPWELAPALTEYIVGELSAVEQLNCILRKHSKE